MFAYCGNNPINASDPSGHLFIELFWEWLTGTGQEVAMADGPAPVGDSVFIVGLGALGFLSLLELGYNAMTSSGNSATVDGISGASAKAFNKAVHQKELSDIASRYGLYECKEAAEAMCKQDNGSSIIKLTFPSGGFVVADNCRFGNQAISRNGQHYGYKDGEGYVHCNVYPGGLPYEAWVNSFHDYTGQRPIVTEIPLVY